ncbi:bridge-like lipid transfer protein family member 3A isoform X3 [Biomphalaria glabrata]|uniref:Bridge-like lipid transfer protein family member 3A isoform X3 n=1 Tax=Biomphalaria glabrata TaxID=6526 RepID=A0A9W3BIS7_BIOGL|nr:bridge-like lipid transfer protein family member 3A isoform X3 [Biomphalaria glabrata]
MASLLKNQILKHLSKFTKNLSADKINLSTLRGEGDLSNLELNEDILTQLLELPTWLRITKAVCSRVSVKIQWTKLKSQPICLYLDEVILEAETCEQPRPPNTQSQQSQGGKYGFVDRVMDGIYIHVNSVVVKLHSHMFHASLQLSRVKVQSMSPTWQTPSDLRSTRIRDPGRGEILLFKEIEWQTTRIEATAKCTDEDFLTPLRLIANQAKIRIVVKKRLIDSTIISSRLILLLDDLLWVLTITQLKAAILYANSLKEVIERSAQQSKKLAAEKLKKQGHMSDNLNLQHQQQRQTERQESATAKLFSRFDVLSTSYHLITSRFDLHLCDDSSPVQEDKRHWKISGGSMQITFFKISFDFYPFHPAELGDLESGERKQWYRYTDNVGSRNHWVNKLFSEFRENAVKLRKVVESAQMTSSSSAPSSLAAQSQPSSNRNLSPSHTQALTNNQGSRSAQSSPLHQQTHKSTRLLESCFVVKIEDMTVYMVSMAGKKRSGTNKLLCSDKRQLHLPPDMSVIHVEFTDYFFPEGLEYPVPHANMYVLVNPVRLTLDFLTLLWSNVFLLTLTNSLDLDSNEQKPSEHVDIKIEMLMPRVIVPAEEKVEGQPDRPEAVQIQISKLVVSNLRTEEKMSREDLKKLLDEYKVARLFSQTDFPNEDGEDTYQRLIPSMFLEHALGLDDPYIDRAVHILLNQVTQKSPTDSHLHLPLSLPSHCLSCNSLKQMAASDIWSAAADQVWLEFLGVQNNKNRPAPFVEAMPVTVWMCSAPCSASHSQKSSTTRPSQVSGQSSEFTTKVNADINCVTFQNGGLGHIMNKETSNHRDIEINSGKSFQHQKHERSSEIGYDNRDSRYQDHDGNSVSHSGREDDKRPTRLPLSGGASTPRLSKKLSRTDSLHDSNTVIDSSSKSNLDDIQSDSGDRSSNQQPFSEQYSESHCQAHHRRDKQYHREDSRSSSSPPLDQSERSSRRRAESRERRSADRHMRHSSSSSIERSHRGHDIEGRSSAEGQISDSHRANSRDVMRKEEFYHNEEKVRSGEMETSHSYPKNRHSSNSSSERASAGSSRSRERRNLYEIQTDEVDKKLPKDLREDRASPRDEFHQRSHRDIYGRRAARDGSRESDKRYPALDSHVFERSTGRPNKREMDGMPLSRKGFSRDRDGGTSDDMSDTHTRRHRSHSRGGDTDSMTSRLERNEDGDSYRPRCTPDDQEYRSRLGEHLHSKHSDADCDNDRFSPTSLSSLDTISRENSQGVVISENRAGGGESHTVTNAEPPEDKAWARINQRSPPDGCKSQDDVCSGDRSGKGQMTPNRKTCILTKVQGKVRAQLNHFQYLFLLRLSESFTAFQNDLSADLEALEAKAFRKRKLPKVPPQPPSVTVIPLMLGELEFAVVCPYQMHQRTFSDDFSLVSPFLLGFSTGQDAVFGDDGDGTCFPQLVDSSKGQRSKDDSALKPFQSSISFKSSSSSQLENVTHLGPPSDLNQRNRAFTSGSTAHVPPSSVIVPVVIAPTSLNSTDIMSQSLNSIGKDSGIGIDRKPQRQQHSKGGSSAGSSRGGTTDMKKAFTSAFSSLTDKLKHKMESLDDSHSIGDDAETLSIRTDTSDDDFEHMSLDDVEEVPAFYHDPPPPEMTPVGGDNYSDIGDIGDSVSMYAESSTTKGKEMVYVVLFKLDHTEIIIENKSNENLTKAQVAKLGSLQLGNISYEDFQARFSTGKGYIQEDISEAPAHRYPIKVKVCKPNPDPNLSTCDPGRMFIQAHDLSLQFKMSGLICLSDFSEDEKLPEALPISVEVRDLLLVLEEDRPPANVTSPGSLPVNLHIKQLSIERGKDGIFYIAGVPSSSSFIYNPLPASQAPPPPSVPKPVFTNAVTSPILSPDGTMSLLMASQNETVLLRRQLEEVRRANRLYEHQILQWRDIQDKMSGVGGRSAMGRGGIPIGMGRKRPSFTADSLSSSPSSQSDRVRLSRDDVDPTKDELERENRQLIEQVARLEDDLLTASKEKESLLQTLQLLQDELLASERKQRSKSKV